jgi:hypothetical protein
VTDARTVLTEGARILTDSGMAVVVAVSSVGVEIRDAFGVTATIGWVDLVTVRNVHDADVVALTEPLRPLWDGLDAIPFS